MTHASIRFTALALTVALTAAVAGCGGIDVRSVRRADAGAQPAADEAIASGRIRFVVDGKPLEYGLLNKPRLQLYHRGRQQQLATPETSSDGSFRWQLPAGEYGVSVVFGGMAPTQQPHQTPGGAVVFVNGLVDPGVEFTLAPRASTELGTLVVEVESRAPSGVLNLTGERVFGRLLAVRVEGGEAMRVEGRKRIVPAPRQP
jgi:hypothetical protein